jgi:HEPN domain-containing protein
VANRTLAASYFRKVRVRLLALDTLFAAEGYSDVVRESQEAHELLCKALLRLVAIDPPKWHDVGSLIEENAGRFPPKIRTQVARISSASKALRKERELSFYGEEDFLPDESYTSEEAGKWISEVKWLFDLIESEYSNELE